MRVVSIISGTVTKGHVSRSFVGDYVCKGISTRLCTRLLNGCEKCSKSFFRFCLKASSQVGQTLLRGLKVGIRPSGCPSCSDQVITRIIRKGGEFSVCPFRLRTFGECTVFNGGGTLSYLGKVSPATKRAIQRGNVGRCKGTLG